MVSVAPRAATFFESKDRIDAKMNVAEMNRVILDGGTRLVVEKLCWEGVKCQHRGWEDAIKRGRYNNRKSTSNTQRAEKEDAVTGNCFIKCPSLRLQAKENGLIAEARMSRIQGVGSANERSRTKKDKASWSSTCRADQTMLVGTPPPTHIFDKEWKQALKRWRGWEIRVTVCRP